jgi:signal transduction histidine kinase
MRAGVGWPDGFIGTQRLSATTSSQGGYTLRRSEPVVVADLRTETRFQVQGQLRGQGAVSGMSVIVHGPQAPWGVLGCHTRKPRVFDEDDVNFLQAVANLLTAAVGRAAAEAALRRRSRQQATIAKLGQRALADRDLPALFAAVVEDVVATLRVDSASILELEADGATLVRRAGLGWGDAAAAYPVQEGTLAKAILDSPAPLVVPDLRSDPRANPEAVGRLGLASLVGVSLPGPGRPWGMLGAMSRTARHFNEDEVNFLQALANLLASALERSRSEAELRRHREDLEGIVAERTALLAASNRELEAFSYTVSHDLRSPLRSIDGMSKILLRKHAPVLPAEAQTLLGHVADGAVRMGKLIESVLTLSRLSRVTLQPVPIDLTAMASGILARHAAQEPGRAVVWGVAPNLTLSGDEGLVRIVLENLLDNAWKFTSKTPDARIWVEPLPEGAGFRVRDNGAGFAMAHAAELFQPFHRLQAEFTGTGIGLATVRRIVQLHGGRVWAHAQPGQGATFHVALGGGAAPS